MADVARLAGVSIATVSRALRGVPGVGEATRDRIKEIADELSYVVSPEASSLSKRETGRVAVVMPRVDAWFYATTLCTLERELRAEGMDVLVYQVDGPLERGAFVRDLPARRKVDAVILAALPLSPEQRDRLDLLGVPMVVAGGRARDLPHVDVDDRAMARAAVDHLLDLGHREIAMVRTSDTDETTWDADLLRIAGYREALTARGIEPRPELLVTEPWATDAGARALAQLMALEQPPTAVFAYSDELAAGVVVGAARTGVRVPEELSVIGVDGHPLAELLSISSVDQHVEQQAEQAAAMTVRLVRGEPGTRSVRVAHTFVDRGSTAPLG
jgi:DNA-binding LacI/PurR family transcriptional regulator